jgi:hypothetical protein
MIVTKKEALAELESYKNDVRKSDLVPISFLGGTIVTLILMIVLVTFFPSKNKDKIK